MIRKIKKNEKGITLIALVITIIVLLILAGVAISMLSGENGILTRASEAKEQTEVAQREEETNLVSMELETYFIINNLKYKCAYGYVTGIDIGEKITQLQKALQAGGYELKAIDGTNNFITEQEGEYIVTTGMAITKNDKEIARTVIFGDVNCDGKVTMDDKTQILKFIDDIELEDYQILASDVDHNAIVNSSSPILENKIKELNNELNETEDEEKYTEIKKQIEELNKENENDVDNIIGQVGGTYEIIQMEYVKDLKKTDCKRSKNVRESYIENISDKFFKNGYKIEKDADSIYIIKGIIRGETTVKEIKELLPENTIVKCGDNVLLDEETINEDQRGKIYNVYTVDSYFGDVIIAKFE